MDIFQLKAFQTLAECQSYTAAAKKLFISQSYLSKLISKLEDELDTKLFKRGRKKTLPTEEGLILLQSSELVLREFERIRRKLYGYKPEKENNLSIAITTCLINNDLLRPFKYFALQFQNVEISILEVPYEQFPELLEVRQVDLAIGWPEDDAMGRLDLNPLLFGLWGIAVHRDHPAAKCDSIEWADIKNERFILPDYEYHFRKHVMRCRQHGFRPYVCCRTTSIVSSLLMVSRNLGVAFIPSFMCLEKYNELVRFVHLLPEEPVSLSIVKRRGNNAPVISEFIDFYTRIFSEQTPISVQTPAEG